MGLSGSDRPWLALRPPAPPASPSQDGGRRTRPSSACSPLPPYASPGAATDEGCPHPAGPGGLSVGGQGLPPAPCPHGFLTLQLNSGWMRPGKRGGRRDGCFWTLRGKRLPGNQWGKLEQGHGAAGTAPHSGTGSVNVALRPAGGTSATRRPLPPAPPRYSPAPQAAESGQFQRVWLVQGQGPAAPNYEDVLASLRSPRGLGSCCPGVCRLRPQAFSATSPPDEVLSEATVRPWDSTTTQHVGVASPEPGPSFPLWLWGVCTLGPARSAVSLR